MSPSSAPSGSTSHRACTKSATRSRLKWSASILATERSGSASGRCAARKSARKWRTISSAKKRAVAFSFESLLGDELRLDRDDEARASGRNKRGRDVVMANADDQALVILRAGLGFCSYSFWWCLPGRFSYAYMTGGDSKVLSHSSGDGVGVLQIEGAIDDSRCVLARAQALSKKCHGSKRWWCASTRPGGAVAPTQEIFEEIRTTKKKKPVSPPWAASRPRAAIISPAPAIRSSPIPAP